jgi:hypothetical protein
VDLDPSKKVLAGDMDLKHIKISICMYRKYYIKIRYCMLGKVR